MDALETRRSEFITPDAEGVDRGPNGGELLQEISGVDVTRHLTSNDHDLLTVHRHAAMVRSIAIATTHASAAPAMLAATSRGSTDRAG
jgi:hypothetical protein